MYGNILKKYASFIRVIILYSVNIIVTLQNFSSAFILMILTNQLQACEG